MIGPVVALCLSVCFSGTLFSEPTSAQQQSPVTIQIAFAGQKPKTAERAHSAPLAGTEAAVWLIPLDRATGRSEIAGFANSSSKRRPRITQHNKQFEPHLLVVQVGAVIDFPNRDPFFHNVFSLFEGKRFDLGLYEAGATNSAQFDRPGVSFLFCNIHPQMSAVVVTVETPYYAIASGPGRAMLTNVPDGTYELHIWSERALTDDLKKQTRVVSVSATNRTLPSIELADNPNFTTAHKNKYGQDYIPPASDGYSH